MNERIMIVEDDAELRKLITDLLAAQGYRAVACADASRALRELAVSSPDLIITDLVMPGMRGDELLREIRHAHPQINVIIITAFGTIASAIALIRDGAFDYITKPFTNALLLETVHRALAESDARRTLAQTAREPGGPLSKVIGQSAPMLSVIEFVGRAARSRLPVLITGESGTGKELIARAIHTMSDRNAFVPVNCGALPDTLVESELFGHEKGAFTGADRTRPGLFEAADNGTIFLDEIGELPLNMQPKLLRALEQGEIRRVGSTEPRFANFRLISASNRSLEEEIAQGGFREDLFWRINVLRTTLPPLRERSEDLPLLVEHFLQEAANDAEKTPLVTQAAMQLLLAYPWPGNARELRNAIQQAMVMTKTHQITPEDLPPRIHSRRWGAHSSAGSGDTPSLRDVERDYILEVLRREGGNRTKAAAVLGLDRKTLYRKLREYEGESASDASSADADG